MGDLLEHVVLVNERDDVLGTMDKLEAHQRGVLHRAFSVFLFDGEDRLLLQQRAAAKYHSGGLWTNTCCSHPRPLEPIQHAAERRLNEEMGIRLTPDHAFTFLYRAEVDNGLIEHELDHVFIHRYAGPVLPDPAEVSDHAWIGTAELEQAMAAHPQRYTAWLKLCWPRVRQHLERTRKA